MPGDDPKLPLSAAQLVGNWCETLVYGIYLVTCTFTVRTLLLRGRGREERWLRFDEIRWLMVFFAAAFFALNTFDIVTGLYHNYLAFILSPGPDGPMDEFLNLANWVNVARSLTHCISMILCNFILVYRCWVIYRRHWLVIAPSIVLYLATLAMAIRVVQLEIAPATNKDTALSTSTDIPAWGISFFCLVTVQNIVSTGLLVFRIWRVDSLCHKYLSSDSSGKRQSRHLRKVITVIAESGALYTTSVFLCLVLVATNSNGFYPITDITLQLTGVVFNLILVRASTSRDRQITYNPALTSFRAATPSHRIMMDTIRHEELEGPVIVLGTNSFKHSQSKIYTPDVSSSSKVEMSA